MPFLWDDPLVMNRGKERCTFRTVVTTVSIVTIIVFVMLLLAALWEVHTAHAATAHMCTLRKIGGSWVKVCR